MRNKGMLSVVIVMLMFFVWALWISSSDSIDVYAETPNPETVYGTEFYSRKEIHPNGTIFSVKTEPKFFSFKGFVQYSKAPRVKERKLKKAKNVYFLKGAKGPGLIEIDGLQDRSKKKVKNVGVVIKYFRHWEGASTFQVVGMDLKRKEELIEQLPVDGEGSWCTRYVFLGPIDKVRFEGESESPQGYIMINDILVGVGTKAFDELEEVTCE